MDLPLSPSSTLPVLKMTLKGTQIIYEVLLNNITKTNNFRFCNIKIQVSNMFQYTHFRSAKSEVDNCKSCAF